MELKLPAIKNNTFETPPLKKENTDKYRITLEPVGFLYFLANVIQVCLL